jgi:hypothetical protein
VKKFIALVVVFTLAGCTMPKKLEYSHLPVNTKNISLTDDRRNDEKLFQEKIIDGETTYFYGDDSFNTSLTDIIKNRLALQNEIQKKNIQITINKITLASSINNVKIDEATYGAAVDSTNAGILPRLLARPFIESIEQSRGLRSIWCHIDYSVGNQEYSEKVVGSAKHEDLSAEISNVFLRAVDSIYTERFQSK